MARSLGRLTLDLVARIGGYEQGLSRAERTTRQRMQGIERSTTAASMALGQLRNIVLAIGGTAVIGRAIKSTADFSQSITDLSAITGATGDDLAYYRKQALDIGRTTSLSATQASAAFKLIASAKPDLLSSAEALNAVTREAVTLAEATGMELPAAASALGAAMNQFKLESSQASEVINILAASAQLGTAEVANVSEALRNAGPAAQALGVDLAETVAGIQALAAAGRQGSDAGTGLRQVMLRLERTGNQNLQPSVVGLTQALETLGAMNLSNTELMAMFGDQAFAAAAALLSQRDVATRLNTTLRGTNSAVEQAATRMDTLQNDVKALGSALQGLMLESLGVNVEELNRKLVQFATKGVNALTDNLDTLKTISQALVAIYITRMIPTVAATTVAYARNVQQIIALDYALARKVVTTKAAAGAYTALNVAARGASAAMALVGGPAGAAIIAAYALSEFTSRAYEARQELRTGSLNEEIAELKENFKKMSEGARGATFAQLTSEQIRLNRELQEANDTYRELEQAVEDAARAGSQFSGASAVARLSNQAGVIKDLEAALQGVAEKQKALFDMGMPNEWKEIERSLENLEESATGVSDEFENVTTALQNQIYEMLNGAEAYEVMNALRRAGVDDMSDEADIIRELIAWRQKLEEQVENEKAQTQTNDEAERIRQSLLSEEERIQESYDRRRQIILDNTLHTGEAQAELLRKLDEQKHADMLQASDDFWTRYLLTAEEALSSMDGMIENTINNLSSGFGAAFESMIFDSQSLGEAFQNLTEGIARTMIRSLGEMAGQWLAYKAVQLAVGKTTQASAAATMSTTASAQVAMAGLNAFTSTAAIPIVGPVLAPGAATAAIAATTPMAATVASLSLAGMAHDGIDSVPATGTWLLEKGERVTTADTSAKLDATLDHIARNINGGGRDVEVNIQNYTGEKVSVTRQQLTEKDVLTIVAGDFTRRGEVHEAAARSLKVMNRAGGAY